jgi:PAS domain S-box-containing protein
MSLRKPTTAIAALASAALVLILLAFPLGMRRPALALPALSLGILAGLGAFLFLFHVLGRMGARLASSEAARRDIEARVGLLRALMDGDQDGICIAREDAPVLDANPAFSRIWGLPPALLEPGNDARRQDFILAQIKDPETFLQKGQTLHAPGAGPASDDVELWDGRVLERRSAPLEGRGRAWRFKDVTSRAVADHFVQRLSQAIEQSPISILLTDTAGTIEFANPRFTQLTGYVLEEALGRNPRILQSGRTPRMVFDDLWATITRGKVWVGELHNRKKDGELFWERATISPLKDAQGVITHYLALKEDITVQKKLEQQLRNSQKLEAVGLLAGGVAHDLNNILQVINGYGTLIQLAQDADDPNRRSLAEILQAAERAGQLTHSLLAFSRRQVMDPRTMDLHAVVTDVEKLLRRVIGEDVALEVQRPDAPITVCVDKGQMGQVLLNLATNARGAMPGGGRLRIATGRFVLDEAFRDERGFGRPGDYARLTVEDDGEPLDEASLKRIFDPYFSTRELGRGTGLGLAMVYGIVKQHHGYILVESGPERGTVFTILLPLAREDAGAREVSRAAPGPVAGSGTILVAEDDPAVRGFMETLLTRHGYKVLLASDGEEAVARYRQHAGSIAMILMDIIMPRKSGRAAFEEIAREFPHAKVLFTSGYTADFIRDRGELGPGMELVMKPVQPVDLLRRIREVLDRPSPRMS